jgi:3-deoxy-D-manno-octulosonic-acid transferase
MLRQLDCVACQSREDGERFLSLGLPPGALQVTGNIKFDLELSAQLRQQSQQLRQDYRAQSRPIWVAASTHPAEESLLLAAFAAVREAVDDCLLVLVPRHPERFDEVYELCTTAGWNTRRRSSGSPPDAGVDIVLGDTVGELLLLLSLARVAFMGGSLVPHGGHNVLEAAVWGVPVLSGPHVFNFGEVSRLLVAAGAMEIVHQPQSLGERCICLLRHPERCHRMGAAGQQVVADNRGARQRLLQLVAAAL